MPFLIAIYPSVQLGALFGVAAFDAANGTPVDIERTGVFDITGVTADIPDWSQRPDGFGFKSAGG